VKTHHVRHFHSHRICTARAIIFILFRHCLSPWILIRMRKRSNGPRFHGRVFHRCDVFSVVPSFFALCDGSYMSKNSELETRLVMHWRLHVLSKRYSRPDRFSWRHRCKSVVETTFPTDRFAWDCSLSSLRKPIQGGGMSIPMQIGLWQKMILPCFHRGAIGRFVDLFCQRSRVF
jgi:hypothetical protein